MTPAALHRTLAGVALAAGLLAALLGNPTPGNPTPRSPTPGSPSSARRGAPESAALAPAALQALAQRIEREEDHVTAQAVAEWLRERRPRLRIVDLRAPGEFAAGHLPGAQNLSLAELVAAGPAPGETLVLVSAGGTHAAQGWVLLAVRGVRDVYTLSGGYDAWLREVMFPELPRDADPAAGAAFARLSELSRYFGGRPRLVDALPPGSPAAPDRGIAERAAQTRRGGC